MVTISLCKLLKRRGRDLEPVSYTHLDVYKRQVQAAVVDGDFRHRAGIQGIEQLRIGEEHGFLVLAPGHQIVDVAEFIGFGELVPHKEDAVRPDTADGDHILHLSLIHISVLLNSSATNNDTVIKGAIPNSSPSVARKVERYSCFLLFPA